MAHVDVKLNWKSLALKIETSHDKTPFLSLTEIENLCFWKSDHLLMFVNYRFLQICDKTC